MAGADAPDLFEAEQARQGQFRNDEKNYRKAIELDESTKDAYYAGSFTWGERQPHCYSGDAAFPGQNVHQRFLPEMAAHILRTAPPGADTRSWRY